MLHTLALTVFFMCVPSIAKSYMPTPPPCKATVIEHKLSAVIVEELRLYKEPKIKNLDSK